MKGGEVFKKAVEKMTESVKTILHNNNIDQSEIDYFIPHQANLRIINNIASRFDINSDKVITTVENHANCSSASIPLALWELKKSKPLKDGDILVFTAFGAGAMWGSAIIRW